MKNPGFNPNLQLTPIKPHENIDGKIQIKNNSFDDIKPKESLKNFINTYFNNKTIISSLDNNEIIVIDNKKAERELNNYTLMADQYFHNQDKEFFKLEDELREKGHILSKEDFSYDVNFTNEDMKLLVKVFGQHEFDFGFNTRDINIDEALLFLRYTKNCSNKEFKRILDYKEEYGVKPFLSLLHGGKEMGDKILTLGEKLSKEYAEKIFAKYGEVIDTVKQTEENIQEVLKGDKKVTPENIQSIKNSLLKKGKDILVNFSNIANKMKEKDSEVENEEVISKLDEIQKENLIFCSIFESLKKSKEPVYFENIKDLEIKRLDARQIPIEDINEMKKIISENYYDKKELQNTLLKSFQNIFENSDSNTDFYILKYKDKIVSFCRFDFIHDKHEIYFGSFNVNKNYGNGMIGTAMLDEVVNNLAVDAKGDYLIKADCNAYSAIGAKYIENGFWANKLYDFAGEPSLAIERDDEFSRDSYTSKKMSKEEIVRITNNEIEKEKFRDMYFTKAKDKEDFQFYKINDENMVLTRYFKDGDSTYLVFEKAKNRKDKSNQEHAYIY